MKETSCNFFVVEQNIFSLLLTLIPFSYVNGCFNISIIVFQELDKAMEKEEFRIISEKVCNILFFLEKTIIDLIIQPSLCYFLTNINMTADFVHH